MENSWLDLDIEQTISEYEFTRGAVLNLNRIISSKDFESMDAHMIFEYLSKEMRIVRFNDFLKRYIHEKAGLEGSLETVEESVFRDIIITSFRDNHVPFSPTASASGYSNAVRKWLRRETVKRETIFLLGFGLRMSDTDVSEFLTKVIQEDDFDLFNAEEAVYWYCLHNDLSYARANQFLKEMTEDKMETPLRYDHLPEEIPWKPLQANPKMYLLTDDQLRYWLIQLKEHGIEESRSRIRWSIFGNLYHKVQQIIANQKCRQEVEKGGKRIWTPEDITPVDVENTLCSGIPKNNMGNLQKMSRSILSGQFQNKRMDRQRITRILSQRTKIGRFDLITLLFYIYAEEVEPDWPVERYLLYIDEINDILEQCGMLGIYPVNPYESFILMCLVTDGPLDVYSEVLEKSFE